MAATMTTSGSFVNHHHHHHQHSIFEIEKTECKSDQQQPVLLLPSFSTPPQTVIMSRCSLLHQYFLLIFFLLCWLKTLQGLTSNATADTNNRAAAPAVLENSTSSLSSSSSSSSPSSSKSLMVSSSVVFHDNNKSQKESSAKLLGAGQVSSNMGDDYLRQRMVNGKRRVLNRRQRSSSPFLSVLDTQVAVERLIRKWAPIVWLAPEEKFMPLGVDEFLSHVHFEHKDEPLNTDSIPVGEISETTYLVTNTDIDKLLENNKSFVYGHNPNISPVPIYAVVTLCPESQIQSSTVPLVGLRGVSGGGGAGGVGGGSIPYPIVKDADGVTVNAGSSRIPYIPIPLNTLIEQNNTLRRASRLYPMFKRIKRTATYPSTLMENLAVNTTSISISTTSASTFSHTNHSNVKHNKTPKKVPTINENIIASNGMDSIKIMMTSTPPTHIASTTTENNNINNFIANLADNVKFSGGIGEISNHMNLDNGTRSEEVFELRGEKPMAAFHVTFWMFYPYSQGKSMCTVNLGPLGSIPFPAVYGYCLGSTKDIGSHIGDWEHMSLYFNNAAEPSAMYVSAHDAGAYYTYNHLTGSFEFLKQETRKGILQRPNFPKTVTTFQNHPVLFAAKGSHGLWTAPGKHRFVKVARLYDINGFGTPWHTWKHVHITYDNLKDNGRSLIPNWLAFKGKWGNPKSKCHPFRRIGLNFCEYTDGPTGIPLKESHFQCGVVNIR